MDDTVSAGRSIIDDNRYMVLGTADAAGAPWTSPVYFAHEDFRDFIWVSRPGARHSTNIGLRPQVSIVVFDSSVPIGEGRGVYMTAVAEELAGHGVERCIQTFSSRSMSHGGVAWGLDQVRTDARHRLYRARAVEQFILDDHDERVPLDLG